MSILVLGGAGYIGSHAVDQLISKGYAVVVVDNLLTGHRSAVHEQATFYEGDIRDKAFLRFSSIISSFSSIGSMTVFFIVVATPAKAATVIAVPTNIPDTNFFIVHSFFQIVFVSIMTEKSKKIQ